MAKEQYDNFSFNQYQGFEGEVEIQRAHRGTFIDSKTDEEVGYFSLTGKVLSVDNPGEKVYDKRDGNPAPDQVEEGAYLQVFVRTYETNVPGPGEKGKKDDFTKARRAFWHEVFPWIAAAYRIKRKEVTQKAYGVFLEKANDEKKKVVRVKTVGEPWDGGVNVRIEVFPEEDLPF